MTQLPMGRLVYTPVTEGREEFLADVKRLGDAAAKAIATGDKSAFRLELERIAKSANDTTKALSPLSKASASIWGLIRNASSALALHRPAPT